MKIPFREHSPDYNKPIRILMYSYVLLGYGIRTKTDYIVIKRLLLGGGGSKTGFTIWKVPDRTLPVYKWEYHNQYEKHGISI